MFLHAFALLSALPVAAPPAVPTAPLTALPTTAPFAVAPAVLATPATPRAVPAQDPQAEVAASYRKLFEARDQAGLAALWREHPDLVLMTIDEDLEGSLALVEASDKPDAKAIAEMHARALFGAQAAIVAGLSPILADYTAAYVGFDAAQQKQFRAGQQAFGKARAAAKAGKHDEALAAGNECLAAAEPLGDWWGTAMGFTAVGQAQLALGQHEQALIAFARARALNHDLGLFGSEYGSLQGMVASLQALKQTARLKEIARQAAALGRSLGDTEGAAELEKVSGS